MTVEEKRSQVHNEFIKKHARLSLSADLKDKVFLCQLLEANWKTSTSPHTSTRIAFWILLKKCHV